MDELMKEIAGNAAQHALDAYFQHLPLPNRLTWYQRFYDAALASMVAFDELNAARQQRRDTLASAN